MISWATAGREIKVHLRSSWTYSLIVIFSLFMALILYISGDVVGLGQYSNAAATMMNLMGYFLPLISLVMGAFSLTMEKEDGSWNLLSTYPLSSGAWIAGKFLGNMLVMATITTFAFSIGGIVVYVSQPFASLDTLLILYGYALSLVIFFLAISVVIGVLSRNRWQALTISVTVWLLFVLAWPVLLMSLLHSLSFRAVIDVLQIATFFNPVEFIRIFFTIKLDGGHLFGPLYVDWVRWAQGPASGLYFIGLAAGWLIVLAGISVFLVERGRSRG